MRLLWSAFVSNKDVTILWYRNIGYSNVFQISNSTVLLIKTAFLMICRLSNQFCGSMSSSKSILREHVVFTSAGGSIQDTGQLWCILPGNQVGHNQLQS